MIFRTGIKTKLPLGFNQKLLKVKRNINTFCIDKKSNKDQTSQSSSGKELVEGQFQDEKSLSTMKKNYEQVEVESFKGKTFSNLTQLQRKIIQEGKFDLSHPQIKPKLASINSMTGLETSENITQIELGNIKIKQKNQVFLSEIDPYNIPEDYDIKFDQEKKLTIVGKRIEKQKGSGDQQTGLSKTAQSSEMPISLAESFEQKSLGQLSQKYMGQIGYKYQFNRKRSFKEFLLAIPLIIFLFEPLFSTLDQVYDCVKSIHDIEEEQMKEITKIKKSRMVHALLNNKDFNQII